MNDEAINTYLSDESDLNKANSLTPRTKYRRMKFSFVCSQCGQVSSKNLNVIVYPFICHKCSLSKSHKTESYAKKYDSTMRDRYGDNYLEVRQDKCNQAIQNKYGGASNMFKMATESRERTMLERYGVVHPSHMTDFAQKCAETKQTRYNSATYNNRDKCYNTLIEKYGSVEAYYKHIGSMSNATKIERYGTTSYNNREKFAQTLMQRYGVTAPMHSKIICDKSHHKYTYNGVKFDSSYELVYYIWLSDFHVDFEYRPGVMFAYEYEGIVHVYNPDFLVNGELVELKGRQFFKDKDPSKSMVNPYNHKLDGLYEAKHQCMLNNGVKIIVDCSEYEQYVATTYGKDYIKSFRNRRGV